jgi:mRNA interferase RelE/StbE
MIVKISKTFEKDITRVEDQKLKQSVFDIIKLTQQVSDLGGIPQLKKLRGHKDFYRINIGLGSAFSKDTVEFLILDHRKDIYKRFP